MVYKIKKQLLIIFLMAIFLINFPCSLLAQEISEEPLKWYRGKVLNILSEKEVESEIDPDLREIIQLLTVRVDSGPYKGEVMDIEHRLTGQLIYDVKVKEGDRVLLLVEETFGRITNIYITDFARDRTTYILMFLFVLAVAIFAGFQGIRAIMGLVVTLGLLIGVFIPLVAEGYNPVNLTMAIVGISSLITFILVGGFHKKTLAGILGTWGGIGFTYILVMYFGRSAYLRGLAEEEAQMLYFAEGFSNFDFQGLIFSAILIGALGAVMDVAMSVASALAEIKKANTKASRKDLIIAGFSLGRDIIGTMTNTLVLAYIGGALPLLLLFLIYDPEFMKIMNLELISTEIIRALIGSLGLIFTAPITTIASAFLESKR